MRSSSSTCRAPIWDEDMVKDAEGKEIEEIPTPVVSKSGRSSGSRKARTRRRQGNRGPRPGRIPAAEEGSSRRAGLGEGRGRREGSKHDHRRARPLPALSASRQVHPPILLRPLSRRAVGQHSRLRAARSSESTSCSTPFRDKDAGVEEQEVVYLADTSSEAAQLNIRKESVGVQDAISAEEIKRAGDSTAKGRGLNASWASRSTRTDASSSAVSLARYNQILLNGLPVPGVDPDVPSVNLDIFPTVIVSNLAVVKVPRPDLPGSFRRRPPADRHRRAIPTRPHYSKSARPSASTR